MKYSSVRFPFIVSFHKIKSGDCSRRVVSLSDYDEKGEELKVLIQNNEEKLSKILRRMIFLESSLDEILEAEPLDKVSEASSSLKEEIKQKNEIFFLGLIPILDSMEAACNSAAESEKLEVTRGLEMIYRKLVMHLSSWDFKQSAALGMKFDPMLHEAVGTGSKAMKPGLITDIILHGWTLNGKVLRFAKVIIEDEFLSGS